MIVQLAWVLIVSALHARGRSRTVRAARAQHEVRGPLAVARLALGGLERSARVEAIDLELRRAALALDELTGPGRARRREPVDLGRLIADAAPAWRALADRHGSALTIEPAAAPVVGDPLRLAQACANLVANALEHGGGTVCVRAWTAGRHARVEVSDDGPGLPAPVPSLLAAAIARSHGGRLTSPPAPHGARLVLEFPTAP